MTNLENLELLLDMKHIDNIFVEFLRDTLIGEDFPTIGMSSKKFSYFELNVSNKLSQNLDLIIEKGIPFLIDVSINKEWKKGTYLIEFDENGEIFLNKVGEYDDFPSDVLLNRAYENLNDYNKKLINICRVLKRV